MKSDIDGIELAASLEEALDNGDKDLAVLKPYLLRAPLEALCIRGGFETDIIIYARHEKTAFFIAMDSAQFGVGEMNEHGDVVDAFHYPNIKMALRSFVGAVTRKKGEA